MDLGNTRTSRRPVIACMAMVIAIVGVPLLAHQTAVEVNAFLQRQPRHGAIHGTGVEKGQTKPVGNSTSRS